MFHNLDFSLLSDLLFLNFEKKKVYFGDLREFGSTFDPNYHNTKNASDCHTIKGRNLLHSHSPVVRFLTVPISNFCRHSCKKAH